LQRGLYLGTRFPNTEPQPGRQVMKHSISFVGLDVPKDSIDIALADDGGNGTIRFYGTIGGDLTSLDKAIRKFLP